MLPPRKRHKDAGKAPKTAAQRPKDPAKRQKDMRERTSRYSNSCAVGALAMLVGCRMLCRWGDAISSPDGRAGRSRRPDRTPFAVMAPSRWPGGPRIRRKRAPPPKPGGGARPDARPGRRQ